MLTWKFNPLVFNLVILVDASGLILVTSRPGRGLHLPWAPAGSPVVISQITYSNHHNSSGRYLGAAKPPKLTNPVKVIQVMN